MLQLDTQSVSEFMQALLPTAPHFAQGRQYFFRGQTDARWGLVPSIRRTASWERFGGARSNGLEFDGDLVISGEEQMLWAERLLLSTAKEVILQRGLSPSLKDKDELLAFAQHIGLPTRGLDWTRSPWTAAYFAGAGALAASRADRLTVFAMSEVYLHNAASMAGVVRLRPSAFGNATLVSQQGILITLPASRRDLLTGVSIRPIATGGGPSPARLDDQLVKITLERTHVHALVRALRCQDVHAASVFPDARGVAELVREVYLTAPKETSMVVSVDDDEVHEAG